jgi:hypothetical protein
MTQGKNCPVILFSFVIPTLGRTQELRACLRSFVSGTVRDFEVIVVDQNDDDRLAGIVTEFSETLPLRHVRVKYRNASSARNDGAALASAQWVGFPDDDSQFLPDTLPQLRAAIRMPGIDLVSGRMLDAAGSASILAWPEREQTIDKRTIFRTLTESSFVIRRDLFQLGGGFDPLFGPGGDYPAGEAMDLILRIMRKARRPLYMHFYPSVRMQHERRGPPFDALAVVRCGIHGRGSGALAARHIGFVLFHSLLCPVARAPLGILLFSGYRRAAKIAWLKGFAGGFLTYLLASRLPAREGWPNCEEGPIARN